MALKVHKVVVVGCPRCVLTGDPSKLGVGKSCFCNRFVRPDSFKLQHDSRVNEEDWRDDPVYNADHFLYWGAATKRHADGTKTRFQIVEQTEFFDLDRDGVVPHRTEEHYIHRASATHFISRGKVAYKVNQEEEYAIPSSLKSNPMRARAIQLFPNNEFSEGKGVSGFICLFDPTLEGENIKIQFDFLTNLLNQLVKTKRKIVVACTKCDEVNQARIQFGANLVASIRSKKPIPFIQTSAKDGINIEEPFHYIVGQHQKKSVHKGSGKNSPLMLGMTYNEIIKTRGKDGTFARATFNRILREKVTKFNEEWNTTWQYLQLDPDCYKAVDVIGLQEAKKMFCQRLMELKVAEVKNATLKQREKKQEEQSRTYQSEILEAFSTHPDLINESAYDFVYTPSLPSNDTPTNPSISPSSTSPVHPSITFNHVTTSGPELQAPPTTNQNSPFITSPPPLPSTPGPPPPGNGLPPVCTEPGDIISYRTPTFSPTRTCLTVNSFASKQLNRSTELLATFPRMNTELQRYSSLRFKNRTLPPLPISRRIDSYNTLPKSITKSQPQLDDTASEETDSTVGVSEVRRKLSSSMDCLQSNSTINDHDEVMETGDFDMEPSPYLRPIDVQAAIANLRGSSPPVGTSSVRVSHTRHYPSIPDGFLTLRRASNSPRTRPRSNTAGSSPRIPDISTLYAKPRSTSDTPPPLPNATILSQSYSNNKSILFSPEKETCLDVVQRVPDILGNDDELLEDNDSVISGPFAEVDETDLLPPLMSEIKKSNESLSKMPNGRIHVSLTSVSSQLSTSPPKKDSGSDGIYASIPAEEDYLTMKNGISMEDLLQTTPSKGGVNTAPLPPAKSVIKRLQRFTNRSESEMNALNVRNSSMSPSPMPSPARNKRESGSSINSNTSKLSIESAPDPMGASPMFSRNWTRATMFNRRPLPQSPTKARKHSLRSHDIKRKNSFGDSNIYEQIDGDAAADWLKQLKTGMLKMSNKEEDSVKSPLYDKIIEHFLSVPQVQELWKSSVKTVYPDFVFPSESSIPPLLINPAYFNNRNISSSTVTTEKVEKPGEDASLSSMGLSVTSGSVVQGDDDNAYILVERTPERTIEGEDQDKVGEPKLLQVPQHKQLSKKESLTDQVLAQLNQRLLQQDSSSSSSEDEDDEDDMEEEDEESYSDSADENSSDDDKEELFNTHRKVSLSSIREQFSYQPGEEDDDDLILLQSHSKSIVETSMLDCIPHLNDYKDSWLQSTAHENSDIILSVDNNDEEESGTGSSSPTVQDTPLISSVIHPTPVKNGNHLAVCHFNSLDSGISANGNTTFIDEQAS